MEETARGQKKLLIYPIQKKKFVVAQCARADNAAAFKRSCTIAATACSVACL
jgi:hypothetical protein